MDGNHSITVRSLNLLLFALFLSTMLGVAVMMMVFLT